MNRIDVSAGAVVLLSLIYFFGGADSLLALLISVAVHELGHIFAISLCGGKVHNMRFNMSGLCIAYSGLISTFSQLLSLLAGSFSGLVLAYAASYFGNMYQNILFLKISGYSLLLSVYNLLPALPLDGGRALRCLCMRVFGTEISDKTLDFTGVATGAVLLFAGAAGIRTQYGLAVMIAGIWVLIAQTGIVKNLSVM